MDFKNFFDEDIPGETYPQKRKYKGKTVFLADKFPVKNLETLTFSIESTDSLHPQGFVITVLKGFVKVDGYAYNGRRAETVNVVYAHEVKDPKHIEIKIYTKMDYIFIKNAWQTVIYEKPMMSYDPAKDTPEHYIKKYPEGKKVSNFIHAGAWSKQSTEGNGAAMYAEEIPNGKRYFCNDGDLDDDFNDIIFTVTRAS